MKTNILVWTCLLLVTMIAQAQTKIIMHPENDVVRSRPIIAVKNGGLWPVLIKDSMDNLHMVIFNQPSHGDVPGDVACYRSRDQGKTWTLRGLPGKRPSPEGTCWAGCLGIAANGDLVALVKSKTDAKDATTKIPTRVMRSNNGGKTWVHTSSLPKAPMDQLSHFPFGRVYLASDSTLRVFTYSAKNQDPSSVTVIMLTSLDDGRTFGDPITVCPGTEVAACELKEGEWLIAVRTGTDVRMRQYRSMDNGRTWKNEGDLTQIAEIPGDFLPLADGRLLFVYGDRREEPGIRLKLSSDNGVSWSESQVLIDLESIDLGYPSAVQLDDGIVLIAYYARKAAYYDGYHTGIIQWDPASIPGQ